MNRINVMKPWLGDDEIQAVAEVIESGWVAQGPRVARFEDAFAHAMQSDHAVATSSCTTALHLAVIVSGIEPGDEVIVPSFSFIATANAPTYVGARPVFADVDLATGNLTAETVERAITHRTRAVIVVDQGGEPVDLQPIRALCDPRGIIVIEDAACGAGSTYQGHPVGRGADITAWSFHPRKLLTTGEGGMLTTSNAQWAARARRLREHSMSVSAAERHTEVLVPAEQYLEVGFNYRMTDLQAAIGLVQLTKLPRMVEHRRQLASVYSTELGTVDGLRPVMDPPWGTSNFQSYWVEALPECTNNRDGLLTSLAKADISARRGIMAAHLQPAYRDEKHPVVLPITERLTENTLILPLYHQMTSDDQARVIGVLRAAATRRGAA